MRRMRWRPSRFTRVRRDCLQFCLSTLMFPSLGAQFQKTGVVSLLAWVESEHVCAARCWVHVGNRPHVRPSSPSPPPQLNALCAETSSSNADTSSEPLPCISASCRKPNRSFSTCANSCSKMCFGDSATIRFFARTMSASVSAIRSSTGGQKRNVPHVPMRSRLLS